MTDTLYHYIYIIREYNDLPLNSATSGEVYMEMYVQYDRIIFSREWLTYDWVMPMHPYMKDYTPFYDAMTYINIIKKPIPTIEPFSFLDFIRELFVWLYHLIGILI